MSTATPGADGPPLDPLRRALVAGVGIAAFLGATRAAARVGGDLPPRAPDLSLPEVNLRQLVRMGASLEEEDVPWWYDGTIFAIVPGEHPRALFRFEGMELYWMRQLPAGEFELIGNTVTFFRDLATGQFLSRWQNPYTGETVDVPAATQGGGPGRGFNYSVRGMRFTPLLAQLPEKPLVLDWTFARDMVWLHNETPYPPGLPPPRAQRQTMFAPVKDFLGNKPSLPAVFSSTVHMPWLKWMAMGDRPGHVVWHASGAKLRSIDELPKEYRARAAREFPALLTADPAKAAERVTPSVKPGDNK
jgi:hypothetical protein